MSKPFTFFNLVEITGDGNGIDIEEFYKNYVATNEEVEKVLNEVFEK